MSLARIRTRSLALGGALAAVVAFGAPAPAALGAPPPGKGVPVTVMTRNLYLGADINRPLVAVQGLTGLAALQAFGNANSTVRTIVDQTNFPARAQLIAHEIAAEQPDLVGLQEVALWRTGALQLDQIGVANATTVKYDYLQSLLDELAALGTPYVAVHVTIESDVEAPAFGGSLAAPVNPQDVRLTMRDVILRSAGDRVKVNDDGGGNYTARIPFSLAGVTYSFIRGYAWADVTVGSKSFRFIDTHLESESSTIANMQAGELLAGAANQAGKPVVVVCDCNSDPLNGNAKPGDFGTPHWAPYRTITGAGFTDEWLQWAPAAQGWTSGLSETVNDADASAFDHRIDMVFAHLATGAPMPVVYGTVVGTKVGDRNADGLWPSDHGGVVLQLRP